VIVEFKRADLTIDAQEALLANNLRGTHIQVGLLLHFGVKPHFRRRVDLNYKEPHLKLNTSGTP
jgi:hypothetical protein